VYIKTKLGSISQIISSPVQRCVDTGFSISIGSGDLIPIVHNSLLRKAFIHSPHEALDLFRRHPSVTLIRMHLQGQNLVGFSDLHTGIRQLYNLAVSKLRSGSKLTLCVTHDLLLITLFMALTQLNLDSLDEEWFGYLDGFCLQEPTNGNLRLYRGLRSFDIAPGVYVNRFPLRLKFNKPANSGAMKWVTIKARFVTLTTILMSLVARLAKSFDLKTRTLKSWE
jgi:hypothetical protein